MPEDKSERKGFVSFSSLSATPAPLRSPGCPPPAATAPGAPATPGSASLPVGHHRKRPFDNRFCRQPKPLAVVTEDPDGRSAPAAEDKQAAGKRIGVEFLPAQLRDSVDALPAIDGFNRNQDADLRRDLDHEAASHNARLKPAKSAAVAPFQWIRSLPFRPSSSIVHSDAPTACGTIISTNAGGIRSIGHRSGRKSCAA